MKNGLTVELHIAKLKAGVEESAFLQAADAVMPDARAMSGFIRREVLKGADGQWVDIIHWESLADAQCAAEAFANLPRGQALVDMVDLTGLTMLYLEQVRSYDK